MTRSERLVLSALALTLLACAGIGASLAAFAHSRWEWRTPGVTQLSDELGASFAGLEQDLLLSYYVSDKTKMPSALRGLEQEVRLALATVRRANPTRIRYQVADPDDDPDLTTWLAATGVQPFRTRRIERDGYREQAVWSSLHVSYGALPETVIPDVGPQQVAHLAALIAGTLKNMQQAQRPRVLIDAPAERFSELQGWLAQRAELVRVDFARDGNLRADADLFIWMEARAADERHLRAIQDFVDSGRCVLLAGSRWQAGPDQSVTPTDFPAERLLGHFGLQASASWMRQASIDGTDERDLRCIAPNQDFRRLDGQPNGNLAFVTPTSVELDSARVRALHWEASVLATTSAGTQPATGEARAAKHALAVCLESPAPRRGRLLYFGAATPFQDGQLARAGHAHAALVDVLWRSLVDAPRLVRNRSSLGAPATLVALDANSRLVWRTATTMLLPALLACIALVRLRGSGSGSGSGSDARRRRLQLTGSAVAVAALAWGASRVSSARLDATRDELHSLAPATAELLSGLQYGQTQAQLELYFTPAARLPASLRGAVQRARRLCRTIAALSPEIALENVDLETTDLAARGVRALEHTSTFDEVTTLRQVVSAVRVVCGERSVVLECAQPDDFRLLEFRIAYALHVVAGAAPLSVAAICDAPRLSPAEAQLDYQERGLFAPTGSDVYQTARSSLTRLGFDVTNVDPRAPQMPADTQLIAWFQPRRSAMPGLTQAAGLLARGGSVFLAAQHYDVIDRRLDAQRADVERWPQPQFMDVERLYLERLGIDIPRAVVFDELHGRPGSDERSTSLEVRASAANHGDHAIVQRIADLTLPSCAGLAWRPAALAPFGITAHTLASTSSAAWTFAWTGGALDPALLERATALEQGGGRASASLPLAALFEGHFPTVTQTDSASPPTLGPVPSARGNLLVVGNAKMFQNEPFSANPAARDFLLQSIIHMGLGASWSALFAHRAVTPGLDVVPARARDHWRMIVIAAGPLLLLALAAARSLASRRS